MNVRFSPRRAAAVLTVAAVACAAVCAAALSATTQRHAAGTPYKIGFIATSTGSQSANFELARQGILAALHVSNGDHLSGHSLQMVFADDGGSPQGAANACNRLVNQEHVQAIIGFESTPARAACDPYLLSKNIPYIAGQPSAGDFCPTNMFVTGFIPNQQIGTMVKYLKKKGITKVYFVGSNYSSAKAAEAALRKLMGDGVLGSSYEAIGTTDWSADIAKVAAAKPQAIVVSFPPSNDEVSFWKEVANDPRVSGLVKFDPLLTTALALATGPGIKGVYSVNTYFPSIKSKGNTFYQATLNKRFGSKAIPDAQSAELWNAVMLLSKALKTAGSTDGDKVIDAISRTTINGPSGKIAYSPKSKGFSNQSVYVAQADANASFKVLASYAHQDPVPTC